MQLKTTLHQQSFLSATQSRIRMFSFKIYTIDEQTHLFRIIICLGLVWQRKTALHQRASWSCICKFSCPLLVFIQHTSTNVFFLQLMSLTPGAFYNVMISGCYKMIDCRPEKVAIFVIFWPLCLNFWMASFCNDFGQDSFQTSKTLVTASQSNPSKKVYFYKSKSFQTA